MQSSGSISYHRDMDLLKGIKIFNKEPKVKTLCEILIKIKKCCTSPYNFEKYVRLSKNIVKRIATDYLSDGNEEDKNAERIEILTECITRTPIRVVLYSNLKNRLSKLKKLNDKVELLKTTIESLGDWPRKNMKVIVACEHFQNRLQEAMALLHCDLRGYLNANWTSGWYDPYDCNVYDKVDCILEGIEDGEIQDSYIYRYKFNRNRMTNYSNDPEALVTIEESIEMKQFDFGRYTSGRSSDMMRTGIIEGYIPRLNAKIEINSVFFLKSLLNYDEKQLQENKKKLNEVINTLVIEILFMRFIKRRFSIHEIEYIFHFIELFIRVVNYIVACSTTENNFIEWFKELQIELRILFMAVNLIKMSELTIPRTINLHVITRIIQLMSIMIRYRQEHHLEDLNDKHNIQKLNKLLLKLAWQLYNDGKSDRPFFIGNETKVEYKSIIVKLPDQPKIKVNQISEKSASKWLEKLQSVDIEAVKKESCLMCGETYSEDMDLAFFLNCSDVICFKCAHHWFRVCDVKQKAYHCMYCFAEVDEYVHLSKVDTIRKMLNLPILREGQE